MINSISNVANSNISAKKKIISANSVNFNANKKPSINQNSIYLNTSSTLKDQNISKFVKTNQISIVKSVNLNNLVSKQNCKGENSSFRNNTDYSLKAYMSNMSTKI